METASNAIAEHALDSARRESDRQHVLNQIQQLKIAKSTSPYGVRWQTDAGNTHKKFFESASDRKYWMKLNENTMVSVETIDPHHWDSRIAKLRARV